MSKWEMVRLGDVCTVERGGSPRPISSYITDDNDGINWIKIGDVEPNAMYINSTKEKIKPEGIKKSRFVNKGDLILSNSMSFGRPYILNIEGCIHDGWLLIRDTKNMFYKNFLYYALCSPFVGMQFNESAVGGVVSNLNSKLVRKTIIPLPPFDVQKKIANTLDKTQEMINGRKKQLKALDKLIKAVFYHMFGDIRTNDKKWDQVRIADVCQNKIETLKKHENIDLIYVDISSINNTEKQIINVKKINSKKAPSRAKQILELNDILVSTVRPNLNSVAVNNISSDQKVVGSTGFCVLRCERAVNYRFLFEITKSEYFIKKLVLLEKGANYPAVTNHDVRSVNIPLPPIDLQNKFAKIANNIEQQKTLIRKLITENEKLLKGLMSKFFD